jgi:hypothetical protein
MMLIFHNVFQKMEAEGIFPNSFCEVIITLIAKPNKDITRKESYKLVSLVSAYAKLLNKILAN